MSAERHYQSRVQARRAALALVCIAAAGCSSDAGPATELGPASAGGSTSTPATNTEAPLAWDNPGKVGMVTLSEIPADAGEKKRPFESTEPLADYDYEWKELLFSGTTPAYTTRIFVKKPRDPARFSGTVFVEWYNVSGGKDFAVMWANSREYFMREGHAFIAVSAQAGGANALKNTIDAER